MLCICKVVCHIWEVVEENNNPKKIWLLKKVQNIRAIQKVFIEEETKLWSLQNFIIAEIMYKIF